jgi:hypothetical protein
MRYDFDTVMALQAKARRERSEAIYGMLIAPIVDFLFRVKHQRKAAHAARPHLAGQG